jgi:cell division protein FtsL
MVKSDEEINLLGQLVVSLTKEILDTNRNIKELEKRITELEKKQPEPSEDKT